MRKFSADYIFPIASPPVKNGVVVTDDKGVILDILSHDEGLEEVEYFEGIICPGFVNAHCHLELSHLKGLLPEKQGLTEFLKPIIHIRNVEKEVMEEAMQQAEQEMLRNGIVAVGDISNDASTFKLKSKSRLIYHTFIEILQLNPEKANEVFQEGKALYQKATELGLPASVAPHAPYTVSPELLRLISDFSKEEKGLISFHNQECEDEDAFFINGTGDIAKVYEELGIQIEYFKPTGKRSLAHSLPHLLPTDKIQLVHNTYTSKDDIEWVQQFKSKIQNPKSKISNLSAESRYNREKAGLKSKIVNRKSKIYWCFCPNANLYIEGRVPDFDLFIKADARITIGTDSLASNQQLSVLEELKTIATHAPHIPTGQLLKWATLNGAEFLGFEKELGTIEKGKQPGLNLLRNLHGRNGGKLTEASNVKKLV